MQRALLVCLALVAAPLLCGLLWTAAAATLLYGRVNAVSLAFGTILVSIGIALPKRTAVAQPGVIDQEIDFEFIAIDRF